MIVFEAAVDAQSSESSDGSDPTEREDKEEPPLLTRASPKRAAAPKKKSRTKLGRRKKAPVRVDDSVPLLSSIDFWRQKLASYRQLMDKKTPLSSLMLLRLSEHDSSQLGCPTTKMSEQLPLQAFDCPGTVLEHSQGRAYRVCDQPITGMCWTDESTVACCAGDRLYILPAMLSTDTSEFEGVHRLASSPDNRGLFAAVCGDYSVRLFGYTGGSLSLLCRLPQSPTEPKHCAFLSSGTLLAVGYYDGTVVIWDWKRLQAVNFVKVCERPICSLAPAHNSGRLLYVGSLDPKVFEVDLLLGTVRVLTSSLASNPLAAYSFFDGVLYADNENHCRFFDTAIPDDPRPRPLGTFDSAVWALAASPHHSVVAAASANGSVHLSWVSEDEAKLFLEKQIIRMSDDLTIDDKPRVVDAPAKDSSRLYSPSVGISCACWCPGAQTPGLLAAASLSGHVFILSCDRHILY